MIALRFVTESVNQQVVIQVPPELDHQKLEIIVLPVGEFTPTPGENTARHKPWPILAGSVVMEDDLITPTVSEEDWDVLK